MSFASLASAACRAYSAEHDGSSCYVQELQGLTGCLDAVLCNANGPSTPGLRSQLAMARRPVLPSSVNRPWAESDRKQSFRSSIPFRAGQRIPTFHPRYLSVYASTQDFDAQAPYTYAAKLDTGPLARSYPGGILPRSSSNHFQFARSLACSSITQSHLCPAAR